MVIYTFSLRNQLRENIKERELPRNFYDVSGASIDVDIVQLKVILLLAKR